MKSILHIAIYTVILSTGCKSAGQTVTADRNPVPVEQPAGTSADYSDPVTWLIGYFSPEILTRPPHSEWFIREKDDYSFNADVIEKLKKIIKPDITVLVVMGTWCSDSRREVPRFMKIVDAVSFPYDRISFVGVDNLKVSPVENYNTLNIERVPTFIFFRNNIEAGRIIENPLASLEQDMTDILTRND